MSERENKFSPELHIMMNVIRAMHKTMEEDWAQQAKKHDLTSPQQHLLWILHFRDGITITEIANLGLWHISTAMHLIDRIEEKGFVRKERLRNDKRASRVFLTERGRALGEKMLNDDMKQNRLFSTIVRKRDEYGYVMGELSEFGLAVTEELYGKQYVDFIVKSAQMIKMKTDRLSLDEDKQ